MAVGDDPVGGNEKVASDPHLLARVLADEREAQTATDRGHAENRERILLRNRELFNRYCELAGGRHLIAYFARFEGQDEAATGMAPPDVAPITALLERNKDIKDLDLLIHSPGGMAHTAEKIVAVCRSLCPGEFRVVVPSMAKSAATMTAICSDQIVMGYLSELGPIDPQVPILVGGLWRYISAQSFLDGQKEALKEIERAQNENRPVIGYLQLLNSSDMSAAWIAEMTREIKFGQDMATKHLKRFMLPRLHPDATSQKLGSTARRIANDLSQANNRLSHGRMIRAEEAKEVGLDIEILERDDERWKALWEIYVRMEIFMQTYPSLDPNDGGPAKLFADAEQTQLVYGG
jgi:Serine dehydrogenase proteinase